VILQTGILENDAEFLTCFNCKIIDIINRATYKIILGKNVNAIFAHKANSPNIKYQTMTIIQATAGNSTSLTSWQMYIIKKSRAVDPSQVDKPDLPA
jgi:hypothetical protein